MLDIPGYTIGKEVQKSQKTFVYRAIRIKDNRSVILKILASEYPTEQDFSRLQRELEIIQSLDIDEVVHSYGIHKFNNKAMLVLEDAPGQSLKSMISSQDFSIELFIDIAIKIINGLGKIHQNNIIHKDIKPANIIVNIKDNKIKIVDFNISSFFPKESEQKRILSQVEGSLTYVSPEQTGWMNRLVDYRTDYYSLGVTLYEMLHKAPPFISQDPLEIIHAHLAKRPENLTSLHPEIPEYISQIILKLLSKNAEDRYKTTDGIISDLQHSLKYLTKSGENDKFVPGRKDFSEKFQIPQKVYGRDKELKVLKDAYERASKRTTELVMVSGEPGIGKTVLIQELYKPVIYDNSLFISGKFEKYTTRIPYNAFIKAFNDLVNQILINNTEHIAQWKEKILDALGENAQVIINMIPRLEFIIGKRTDSTQPNSLDLQTIFHRVFLRFVAVFATKDKPLVIFIDDLQWADSSSLKLIEVLMTNSALKHILFIGSYRESEKQENILLTNTINNIREFRQENINFLELDIPIEFIALSAIDQKAISELIYDTLNCEKQEATKLAKLIFMQTAGNPFFVNQFLTAIHHESLVKYDHEQTQWVWSIDKIKKFGFTDNVIQLMTSKIESVLPRTTEVLQLASCIGNHFDLEMLSSIDKNPLGVVRADLIEAIHEELILSINDKTSESNNMYFKFQHDQILDTVYSMIAPDLKKEIHLEIGRLSIERLPKIYDGSKRLTADKSITDLASIAVYVKDESSMQALLDWMDASIFSIVNHFNKGYDEIKGKKNTFVIIILNVLAAKKARQSAAFGSALEYLNVAHKLLPKNSWKKEYFLTLQLYTEMAECEYINVNFLNAGKLCKDILKQAHSIIDKGKAFEIIIASLTRQSKFNEAIASGYSALLELGVRLPKKPTELSPLLDIITANVKMGGNIGRLIELPRMKDKEKLAAMNVMIQLVTPSFISSPKLFPVLVLKMVHLTLKYGLSNQSAYAFAFFGAILGSGMGKHEKSDKLAKLAVQTLSAIPSGPVDCKVLFCVGNLIHHWKHSFSEGQEILEKAYTKGLETGDLLFTGYSLNWLNAYNYFTRKNIPETLDEMTKHRGVHERINQEDAQVFYNLWMQFIITLSENNKISKKIKGDYFDEDVSVKIWQKINNDTDLFIFHLMKAILYFLKRDNAKALGHIEKAVPHATGVFGMPVIPEHNFFYSLIATALAKQSSGSNRKKYIGIAISNQKKMKTWAKNAPMNYEHKYLIVEAEIAQLQKRTDAIKFYEKAISSASTYKFTLEQAIANELLADLYFSLDKNFLAVAYLKESCNLYYNWGALSKVSELENEFPNNLSRRSFDSTEFSDSHEMSTMHSTQNIDLKTVLKVSQNISSEIDLHRLTSKLILLAIENAGAEKGVFITNEQDQLIQQAEGSFNDENFLTFQGVPIEKSLNVPIQVVKYVARTMEPVLLMNAIGDSRFGKDPYILSNNIKSILCMPVRRQGKTVGLMYLENNLSTGVFTEHRMELLDMISAQVAISLDNAKQYETLEKKVFERTTIIEEEKGKLQIALQKNVDANRILERLAAIDGLTGLVNRRQFDDFMKVEWKNAIRENSPLSLIMIDIDYFKKYNDGFGHQKGDDCIKKVATAILAKLKRPTDIAARYGGEEFVVILPTTTKESALMIAEEIQLYIESLSLNHVYSEISDVITVSAGVGTIRATAKNSPAILIEMADKALYLAKHAGRNQVKTFEDIK
ncbi:MAG: diguanylate cyclase [Leptospirales bacterium]